MPVTTIKTVKNYPNHVSYLGANDTAGEVIFTLTPEECSHYDSYMFLSWVGVVTVEVELVAGGGWSNPVALQDMNGTLIDQAAVTTNKNLFGLVGRFSGLRVKASGGAAECHMTAFAGGRKS